MIKIEDKGFGDDLFDKAHRDDGESSDEVLTLSAHMISKDEPQRGGDRVINGGERDETERGDYGNRNLGGDPGRDLGGDVGRDLGDELDRVGSEEFNGGGEEDGANSMRRKKLRRTRKSHMNFQAQRDESCLVCVCSVEGKDQYCSRRPAMNVNECLRMADVMEDFQKNVPFDVDRVLANRIRRGQGGPASTNQGTILT